MVENQESGWVRKTWQELKSLGRTVFPVIAPPKSAHPGAVHGAKNVGKRRLYKTSHFHRGSPGLTNHERVILGRAHRMRISEQEYQRRFCK